MPASESIGKICLVCHADVSQVKRVKDSKGNYYCEPCYAARKQSAKPADRPAPSPDSDDLDLAPRAAHTPKSSRSATTPCPGCNKPLPPATVFCVNCGYNLKLGKQAATSLQAAAAPTETTDRKSWLALVPLEIFLTVGAIALFAAICIAAPSFTNEVNKVYGVSMAILIAIILSNGSNKCRRILVDEYGWSETLFRIPVIRNFVSFAGLFSAPKTFLITIRYGAAALVFTVVAFFLLAKFARPDPAEHADASPEAPPSQVSNSKEFAAPPTFVSATKRTEVARLACAGPDGGQRQMWIYRLKGNHPARSMPCLLIAPGGTPTIYGATLDEDAADQYKAYARDNFIVVAYSLDGPLEYTEGDEFQAAIRAIKKFQASRGGIANAQQAIDYVLRNLPEVDPGRLYAMGAGSGGAVALCLAAAEPRISAVYAIAPVTDAIDRPDADSDLAKIRAEIPDIRDFVKQVSPTTHVREIKCPVFLYQPGLDILQTRSAVEAYWKALDKAGVEVRYALGPSDLESMKNADPSPGITWLKTHKAAPKPTATTPAPKP
jgi:acetyl esterase/lipase